MSDLINKLKNLQEEFKDPQFPEDLETLKSWEMQVREAEKVKELGIVLAKMRGDMEEKIKKINQSLVNDREADSDKRKWWFHQRDLYEWFLGIFTKASEVVKEIKQSVKDNS